MEWVASLGMNRYERTSLRGRMSVSLLYQAHVIFCSLAAIVAIAIADSGDHDDSRWRMATRHVQGTTSARSRHHGRTVTRTEGAGPWSKEPIFHSTNANKNRDRISLLDVSLMGTLTDGHRRKDAPDGA